MAVFTFPGVEADNLHLIDWDVLRDKLSDERSGIFSQTVCWGVAEDIESM